MANWKKYKFTDFVEINPSVKLIPNQNYSFIEMKDLNDGQRFAYPSVQRTLTGGARFQEEDTLFARITPCLENGKICQAKGLLNGEGFGSTEFLIFRCKKDVSDSTFVFYLSRWDEIRRFAELNMIGTSGRQRVPKEVFQNLELDLPEDLPTQTRIASILSSLDDKIELNRRTNQTLEQIAQTLFKKYFVTDIDPDNLPEGWRLSSLNLIADYLNGIALQKFKPLNQTQYLPVVKIKELKNGISATTEKADINIPQQYVINDGDVIFSWSGSLEVDIWCDGKGALNQHLFKVTSKKFPKWFYYLWTKEHLANFKNIAASKATTMGHIQRHHLSEAEVYIPPVKLLMQFNVIINPIIELIISNRIENRSTNQIRNSLLPKLMNGEIEVN